MATYTSKKAYMYGTGRRKSSVARVHLFPNGTGSITVNGRPLDDYFGLETLKLIVRQPFAATDTMGKFDVEATVTGGGVTGQAGAIRHGIARALLQVEDSYRAPLKAAGLLTRDPRMKERKKYGLICQVFFCILRRIFHHFFQRRVQAFADFRAFRDTEW